MRARLALVSAGITCELREIVLRDKAAAFLTTSPKGTVPVLVVGDDVIEESFDIMLWALRRDDPEGWLTMPNQGFELIAEVEGPFKTALDRYKYETRYDGVDTTAEREKASLTLRKMDGMLSGPWLFGDQPTLADMATVTFVRQFANVDKAWFDAQPWSNLSRWLEDFVESDRFVGIMAKYPKWEPEHAPIFFPTP